MLLQDRTTKLNLRIKFAVAVVGEAKKQLKELPELGISFQRVKLTELSGYGEGVHESKMIASVTAVHPLRYSFALNYAICKTLKALACDVLCRTGLSKGASEDVHSRQSASREALICGFVLVLEIRQMFYFCPLFQKYHRIQCF